MAALRTAVATLALAACAQAAIQADEITSLPGWEGDLPSKMCVSGPSGRSGILAAYAGCACAGPAADARAPRH